MTFETLPSLGNKEQLMKEEKNFYLKQQTKACLEALLFSSDTPLKLSRLKEIIDSLHPIKIKALQQILAEMQYEYHSQKRGFILEEIAEGFILRTSQDFAPQLSLLHANKRIERLSHASTEVLAIIAYKQPLTRSGIEAVRGVDSTGSLHNLLERDLVEPVGKQASPGKPTLYGTTPYFLQYFGLKDLSELQEIFPLETSSEKKAPPDEQMNLAFEAPEIREEKQSNQLSPPLKEEVEEEEQGFELAIDLKEND